MGAHTTVGRRVDGCMPAARRQRQARHGVVTTTRPARERRLRTRGEDFDAPLPRHLHRLQRCRSRCVHSAHPPHVPAEQVPQQPQVERGGQQPGVFAQYEANLS